MIEIHRITTERLNEFWPDLAPHIKRAADRYSRDYSLQEVREAIISGDAILFGVHDGTDFVGAITATTIDYPRRTILLIELVGGTGVKNWYVEAIEALTVLAKAAGCGAIRAEARKGWKMMSNDVGFKEISVTYEKVL